MAATRRPDGRVPALRGVVLVHGAGSGPWIFDGWERAFPGLELAAVDLHTGLQVGEAAMSNYASVVARAAEWLPRPVALCGWSMGGLAAALAARQAEAARLVLLEPSPPRETQGSDPAVPLETGTYDPEEAYGRFPRGIRARPESRLARSERKRGVSVPSLACPALVIHGDEFAADRGRAIARYYGAEELAVPGLDHWGLVLDEAVRASIATWLLADLRSIAHNPSSGRLAQEGRQMTKNGT